MSNLREKYNSELKGVLQEKLGIKNVMAVPRLTKVVINMGVGEAANDKKHLESAVQNLTAIAGQKPVITKARKSVAGFKLREGSNVGVKVTLRKARMYEFLDRLVNIALPRIKDFKGLSSKGFDKFGNYTFGVKEHIIFPEVNFDKVDKIRGLDISISISSPSKQASIELLKSFNFPLQEKIN